MKSGGCKKEGAGLVTKRKGVNTNACSHQVFFLAQLSSKFPYQFGTFDVRELN